MAKAIICLGLAIAFTYHLISSQATWSIGTVVVGILCYGWFILMLCGPLIEQIRKWTKSAIHKGRSDDELLEQYELGHLTQKDYIDLVCRKHSTKGDL